MDDGNLPPVDPTKLTTDAVNAAKEDLRREIKEAERLRIIEHTTLHNLVFAAIDARKEDTQALRIEVLSNSRRVEEGVVLRFNAVDQRFTERDTRTEQAAQESRISLDAALAAAKEAVGEQNKSNNQSISKSETSTMKLIEGLQVLMSTNTDATNDKIADLRTRLDRGEGNITGATNLRIAQRAGVSQNTAVITASLISLSIVVSTLIAVFHK